MAVPTDIYQRALQGDPDCKYTVGMHFLEQGDITLAADWLQQAAATGHQRSIEAIISIPPKLLMTTSFTSSKRQLVSDDDSTQSKRRLTD